MSDPATIIEVPDRISSEDGTLNWFRADKMTKAAARRIIADEACEPVGEYSVCRRHMRPATLNDPGTCLQQLQEGWWTECDRREPGAFAVWRVE